VNDQIKKTGPAPSPGRPALNIKLPEKKVTFNRKHWLIAALVLLLFLGGAGAWYFRSDDSVEKIKQMGKELFENRSKLSREERREKFREFRNEVEKLSPEQRRELGAERRQQETERLKKYFSMSPEDKEKDLDKRIDQMQAMRERREADRERRQQERAARAEAGGESKEKKDSNQEGDANNRWGRRGKLSAEERLQKMRSRLDSTTAEERGMRYQFFHDLRARMGQRGMSMGGRGGGGPGGGGWGR
jgi:hypothetical protein